MTKRSKNASRREEMTPSEKRATVTIFSSLKDIEKGRKIYFSLKGKGLTIDYLIPSFIGNRTNEKKLFLPIIGKLSKFITYPFVFPITNVGISISDNSFSLHFTDGITKEVPTPEGYCRLMINNIISDLRRGKIKSKTEYDFRKFDARYLKDLKELLSQKTTTTGLQEKSTTKGVEHETQATGVTDSTTTELFDSSQSEKPTTEGVEHEMQEDSEYFAVEPAPLKQQKLDALGETTKEINRVMEEITESNTNNGTASENIEYLQSTIRGDVAFSSSNFSSRVPAFSKLSSTNVPQLSNESGITGTTVAGLSTLSICVFGTLGLLGAAMGFGYWLWHEKSRKGSYNVKKAGGVESPEGSSLLPGSSKAYTTDGVKEPDSLLDEVKIEPGKYKSFQRNISDIL